MDESNPSDAALVELLSLTMEVSQWGATVYRNHLGHKHRIHGPAVKLADGSECWYQNGLLHRTDGPAIEYPDGSRFWYLNDESLTEQEYNERIKSV